MKNLFIVFVFISLILQCEAQNSAKFQIDSIEFDSAKVYTAAHLSEKNKKYLPWPDEYIAVDSLSGKVFSYEKTKELIRIVSDSTNYKACLHEKCFETEYYYVFYNNGQIVLVIEFATDYCAAIGTKQLLKGLQHMRETCQYGGKTHSLRLSNDGLTIYRQFYNSVK